LSSRHVFINPDNKIVVKDRRCVEIALPDDLEPEENSDIIAYLESQIQGNGSVYPNPDCAISEDEENPTLNIEAFFWIPPDEEILKEEYSEAPQAILDCLMAAFIDARERGLEDYGYALIGYF
jgi:hypothetical protein